MGLAETSVGQIADLLRDKGGPKACLLVGAGVSKTAGIGLAEDYVARIREEYPAIYDATCISVGKGRVPGYADCMAALPPAKQVQLVRADIDRSKINWAHIGIARLECADVIDSILTPNFDPLASRACALFHRFPAIYDLAGLRDDSADHIDFDRSYVRGSAIFHLHGQHTGFLLLNTEDKLRKQAKRVRPVLDATMKGKPVIIAGYSGGNDPLVSEIAALAPFNHGLFWVVHDDADPAPRVCQHLLSKPNCYLVRNMPADRFFTDLANSLKLEAPKFMFNPFEHMLGILDTIESFSSEGGSPQDNLLAQAKYNLKSAAETLRGKGKRNNIAKLIAEGEYNEVWERFGKSPERLNLAERVQVSWAGVEIGISILKQAEEENQEKQKHALLTEAELLFNRAIEINSKNEWALSNLGNTLIYLARMEGTKTAASLLQQAKKHFAAATATSSEPDTVLNNWGCALTDEAKRKRGTAADACFAEGAEKFSAAIESNPKNAEALNNWGILLGLWASKKEGTEAEALYAEAEEKYNLADKYAPGRATYNRACLAALRGDASAAAALLVESKLRNVSFPGCDHVLKDEDFARIRGTPEYQNALAAIGCVNVE